MNRREFFKLSALGLSPLVVSMPTIEPSEPEAEYVRPYLGDVPVIAAEVLNIGKKDYSQYPKKKCINCNMWSVPGYVVCRSHGAGALKVSNSCTIQTSYQESVWLRANKPNQFMCKHLDHAVIIEGFEWSPYSDFDFSTVKIKDGMYILDDVATSIYGQFQNFMILDNVSNQI